MSKLHEWDSIEAFLLKECYTLASYFETNESAKKILRKKTKIIDVPADYIPAQIDATYIESEMQIVSEALYELSLEGFSASEKSGFKSAYKINNLPSSAEKELLLALISLRNGTNETQRIDALRHLSAALSFSPNDPRFIALIKVLQEAGNA